MKLTPVNVHKSGHFVNFIDLLLPLLMSENLFLTWIGQESSRDEKLPSIVPSNDNRRQFNWFVFRSVTVFVLCADAWKGRRRNLLHFFSVVVPLRCGCEVVVIAIVIVIDVILSIVFVFFDFLPRTWNSIWLWNCDAKYCSPKHSGHSHPFTLQPTVKGCMCVCAWMPSIDSAIVNSVGAYTFHICVNCQTWRDEWTHRKRSNVVSDWRVTWWRHSDFCYSRVFHMRKSNEAPPATCTEHTSFRHHICTLIDWWHRYTLLHLVSDRSVLLFYRCLCCRLFAAIACMHENETKMEKTAAEKFRCALLFPIG